ncbi:alpha/beta fold hydrolase [Demequina sp. NBRC 110054]|uniref:alpha/beta fold hydrolase n=1 Tax=Demequina sp. NBRC 110054 TaxID=1570343 RepID=UPI0009FBBDDE|nr:alpha/beta fold hydrolase [Demequina sp. NBRC 110054]
MRAVQSTREGFVERDEARLHYDVYEHLCPEDAPSIVLLPTWTVVHAEAWKMQIPYLAHHYRVVVYDAARSGQSTGPRRADRHTQSARLADATAVIEATCAEPVLIAGVSMGGTLTYSVMAYRPDLVRGAVIFGANHPFLVDPPGWRDVPPAYHPATNPRPEGWAKVNPEYMSQEWRDFVSFFMAQVASDEHSTKAIDDLTAWAMSQDPEVAIAAITQAEDLDLEDWRRRLSESTIPTLIIHGTDDQICHPDCSRLAAATIPTARLLIDEGVGHVPGSRYPVLNNHRLRDFADEVFDREPRPGSERWRALHPEPTREELDATAWAAPASSPRKALYLSSPIGLGHARRDVAIAEELRSLHPDLVIDWLADDPVTQVLEASGERIHPASRLLASELAVLEAECGEHSLNVLEAVRDMDAVQLHNFHLLDELTASEHYDLVIADEAWELDYHLFENPHLKRSPLAWMTDFVGNYAMPSGGERQVEVVNDMNAQMVEHVADHPGLRDASVFVGSETDVPEDPLGPGLPTMREWTEQHFDFAGYITGFDPRTLGDRERLRAELGFGEREKVCMVCVGGSGVGVDLIRRVVAAASTVRRTLPELRMIVVTGPRIDRSRMPVVEGVEYHAYVDRLYRWLAACDVAIVQGGLTTTMELTASRVPFIYVPLREHFEQNHHVAARLRRYRAGLRMDYDELSPERVADALGALLASEPDYLPVETDGAARAAALIGAVL